MDGGTTASYAYDGNRWRVQKTVAGATTTYVYSGSKVIAEYVNGSLGKEYIYSGGQLLATISGGITNYQYADQLSTRLETDGTGALTRTFGHYPFGESWYETGAANKWKFTSYERDSESNLDYALNRFDSSRLGRFMSPDLLSGSISAPQSLNRYSYVLNDPIGLVDPLGTGPCDPEDYSPEDCAALTAFQNHGLGAGAGGAGDSNNSYMIFRPGRQDNGGDGGNSDSYAKNFVKALVKDFSLKGARNQDESFSACVDRVQNDLLGKTGSFILNTAIPVDGFVALYTVPTVKVPFPSAAVDEYELAHFTRGVESTVSFSSYELDVASNTASAARVAAAGSRTTAINSVAAPAFAGLLGLKLGFYAACR